MPSFCACFCTSLSSFITISGRYGKPYWLTSTMLDTSLAIAERRSAGIARTAGATARALQKSRLRIIGSSCCPPGSCLHAPALDRSGLYEAKYDVLDREADEDDGQQPREDFRNVELILALENVPAEPALAGRHAEHKLGGDQRAPREGPADLQAGENARERRRDEDFRDEAQPAEIVVAPDHP